MAVIRRHFITFLQHEPGARLGEDPEELHDMRVATRRMRASMSTFRDVLPEGMEALREELKWIAGCLGEVRDLDVQIDWLEDLRRRSSWDEATALGPLIENRATLRQEARQALLEAMAGERYAALVSSMGAALREPVLPPEEPAAAVFAPHDVLEPLPEFGYRVLRKRYRRLRRAAEALTPDSEQTDYHATRILAKRLRYAAEALTPAFGEPARELVQDLKALQDVLGEMQDAAVGIEWIRAAALGAEGWPSASLLRAGELIEQQRRRIDALREQSPEASDAVKKRWRRLQRAVRKAEKQDAEPLPAAPADAPEDRLTSQMPEHVAYRRSLLQWLLRRQQPPSG